MHQPPTRARRTLPLLLRTAAGALLLAGGGAWLGGCDNPACVFSGNCNSGGGGGGGGGTTDPNSSGVVFPVDGEWIVDGAPRFDAVLPTDTANTTSPLLLLASESLNPASVSGAFRLVEQSDTGMGTTTSLSAALTGDGRALILRPMGALAPGSTYDIEFTSSAVVRDLTGVALVKPVSNLVGSFSVSTQPANAPQLVGSWPRDNATNMSAIGEIVVVFDRPMNSATVDASSFVVTVDGSALSPTTVPEVLRPGGGAPESRVYTWRHVDADGVPIPLTAGGTVRVDLSPSGHAITDVSGTALANTTIDFQLAPFSLPASAEILTDPSDAIGIEHLVGSMPLMVQVDFPEPTQAGDVLHIDLFGIGVTSGLNSYLPRTFSPAAASSSVVLGPSELGLVTTADPLLAVFADGEVGFAFRLMRGSAVTPVRLLDTDAASEGIQDPVLDTVAPEFDAFGSQGNDSNTFRSDLFDLAVVGRASETLRSVEVTATVDVNGTPQTFTNGQIPTLPGSNADGLFVAAPIPGTSFEEVEGSPVQIGVRLYDRALNQSPDLTAAYVRRGIVGGGVPPLGVVTLRAYDAGTVEPVAGAMVFLHVLADGGGVGGTGTVVHALGPFATDSDGVARISVPPQGDLLFTVDATGYDLFSLESARTRLVDVPLVPTPIPTALLRQAITSPAQELDALQRVGADSRRAPLGLAAVLEMTCTTDPFTQSVTCITLPDLELAGYLLAAGRPGAFTFLGLDTPSAPQNFDPETYLQAFLYSYPRAGLEASAMALSNTAPLGPFLADLGDPEELALAAPPFQVDATDVAGFTSDPQPDVRVEGSSPGVADPVVLGFGTAFDLDGNLVWDVLSAYPGAVDPIQGTGGDELGRYVRSGTVDDLLRVAVELTDVSGARTALRPSIGSSPPTTALVALDVPELLSPVNGTGGTTFDVVLRHVLASDQPGIYSAELREIFPQTGPGRGWRLWRVIPAGFASSEVRIRVPNITALGGTPLVATQLSVRGDVRSYADLDVASFAWTELARRAERSAASATRLVTNP